MRRVSYVLLILTLLVTSFSFMAWVFSYERIDCAENTYWPHKLEEPKEVFLYEGATHTALFKRWRWAPWPFMRIPDRRCSFCREGDSAKCRGSYVLVRDSIREGLCSVEIPQRTFHCPNAPLSRRFPITSAW